MEVGVGQGPADPYCGIDPLDGLDGGPVNGDLLLPRVSSQTATQNVIEKGKKYAFLW